MSVCLALSDSASYCTAQLTTRPVIERVDFAAAAVLLMAPDHVLHGAFREQLAAMVAQTVAPMNALL